MKYTSILLLSLGLASGSVFAGGNTDAGIGGALGGVLGPLSATQSAAAPVQPLAQVWVVQQAAR